MTLARHIAHLPRAEQIAALDRWCAWYAWDCATEYSPDDELLYQEALYLTARLECECDADELEDYRLAAMATPGTP